MRARVLLMTITAGLATVLAPPVGAQALGTFRWQLQPFCNVVTVSVRQDGAVYTLDGTDDQCGAASSGAVAGTAFLNPDGSIGMGLSGVIGSGAAPVVTYAQLQLATVSGTWTDSAGNGGTFVFTTGPGTGGPARPVPPNGIRPASITSAQLAPGAVGAAQIAAGSITAAQLALGTITGAQIAAGTITVAHLAPGTAQPPIAGTCPVGQYLRGVSAGGAVICEPFFAPTLSTRADDLPTDVGGSPSIAIGTDGLPVISHRDAVQQALRVTKCGNPGCTAGNVSATIDDPASSVGYTSSIKIGADGLPIIAHLNYGASMLRVTKCGNAACTAGNVSTDVDGAAGGAGFVPSMAIAPDGLPVISHHDLGAGALRITKCGNASCTAGNVSTTVDDPANVVAFWTSIAIGADGLPIVAHHDMTAGALRVTKCGNAACTAGNVSTNVDTPATRAGAYASLAIGNDGLPVIAHQDDTLGELRVTKCGNATCTSGTVTTVVDQFSGSAGYEPSITIGADGLPVVSHAVPSALRVTKCGNASCTAGHVSTTVDNPPGNQVGLGSSIAIAPDGLPVIAHYDQTARTLRVTKCGTQSCR